jgi:hypothetical protein
MFDQRLLLAGISSGCCSSNKHEDPVPVPTTVRMAFSGPTSRNLMQLRGVRAGKTANFAKYNGVVLWVLGHGEAFNKIGYINSSGRCVKQCFSPRVVRLKRFLNTIYFLTYE